MLFLKLIIVGLLVCFADALKIDVTINGNHEQSIPKGSDIILNCSASQGDSADRLDWLKDNQSITENVVPQSVQGGVLWSSLLLQNVFPANVTGMYTCRSWKNNSRKATVQRAICVDDIRLRIRPRMARAKVGDSRIITCKAQGSCNSPNLQWLDQSGDVITHQDKIQSTSNTELKLKLMDLKVKDKGYYKCRAMDSDGREVKRARMYINVIGKETPEPPIITSPHQDVLGYHGSHVTLSFITQHTPQFVTHPTWYFGGEVLHSSKKYTMHKSSFPVNEQGLFSITVHNLTEEDSGNYTLNVTTTVKPPAIGHVQLHVIRKENSYEMRGMKFQVPTSYSPVTELTCEAKHPVNDKHSPQLYWSLNGTRLIPQSKYKTNWNKRHQTPFTLIKMTLKIFNYSESDCRWYTCGMNTSQELIEKTVAPCRMNKTDSQAPHHPVIRRSHVWISILVAISCISTIGVTVACLSLRKCKRKRLYRMTKGLHINKELEVPQWDLFISYASKDFEWVSKHLLPLLEENHISYSIHSKDFEAGKTIVDNMADSVYKCKQVVAILSENYIKSKFCRAELDMAICRHASTEGSCLTVIKMDGISAKKFPRKTGKKVHIESVEKDESNWGKRLMGHLIPLISQTNSPSKA